MKSKKFRKENFSSSKKPASNSDLSAQRNNYYALFLVLVVTFIVYLPALKAGFVDWDDEAYVVNNLLIRNFSKLKELLLTPVQGNFHPLTMLSLTLNYAISGLNAWSYHLFNILLHLANIFLVFVLAGKLSKNNLIIPITTAMLFALHPMHVESVAWVSERKDVLYGFFFLLGLISYVKYIDINSRKSFLLCILWFVLSLASKPSAVIFPITLFTIDILRKRKFSKSMVMEKIPFLLFSIMIGFYTYHIQTSEGAVESEFKYFKFERFFFGFYGFLMYVYKLVYPLNLATFYPYPPVNKTLPVIYYLSPLFFIATFILCLKNIKRSIVLSFGFSFYLITLLLVLQFVLVGSAIIADRYTYIPYFGLFYIIGWLIDQWKNHSFKKAVPYLASIAIILSVLSYNQAATWKNSSTLWDQAIKAYPSSNAYLNRALIFRREGDNKKAIENFDEAVKLNINDPTLFLGRGNANYDIGNIEMAQKDFNSALKLKPGYLDALNSRGALFGSKHQNDSALFDLNRAISINPGYIMAYKNRALVYVNMNKFTEAINDFNKFLESQPGDANIISTIGVCYQSLKEYEKSIPFFDKAISIDPRPVFYLNRSYSWNALGKTQEARNDAVVAKQAGLEIPEYYAKYYGL